MNLKFLKLISEFQEPEFKIVSVAWSPNNQKLAVATSRRQILLFNENGEKKDRFSTKPSDPEAGKKSYVIISVSFSPDSTKLAVAQSDCTVYVYKIGEEWGEKKEICNKFVQHEAVTACIWLLSGPIICGLRDGKVRVLQIKSNKSQSLYNSNSMVISLFPNSRGTGFLSGHIDGTVIRCVIGEEYSNPTTKLIVHNTPPYLLVWNQNYVFLSGNDRRILVYNMDGKVVKTFDYSKNKEVREFTVGYSSPGGQTVAIGNFDKLFIYSWNSSMSLWEESNVKIIENFSSVTALSWKNDGSKIVLGSLIGHIMLFESVLKRKIIKNLFEIIYVGPSQILIKSLTSNSKEFSIQSYLQKEIYDVKIMGRDSYVVAKTSDSLIVGDINSRKFSEVLWNSENQEKFYFENPNICLIFNLGEIALIEYGENNLLASIRTEFANPHLISVRINEHNSKQTENKKLAYLLDLKTICILNLVTDMVICQISHDCKIDWLELSETCTKLLFRDVKKRLLLLDVDTGEKSCIFSGVTFAQWVEGSDVAVAQSGQNLAAWYNIDVPDNPTIVTVTGEVIDVIRNENKTQAILVDGNKTFTIELDNGLVEFGTAIQNKDYQGAVFFLEQIKNSSEAESMWQNLYNIGLSENDTLLIERCSAALNNITQTFYLQETNKIGTEYAKTYSSPVKDCPEVWIRLAILKGDLETAESIYVEQGRLDDALKMYVKLHKWDKALRLAKKTMHPDFSKLKQDYIKTLLSTGNFEKAGMYFEKENDNEQAITMYMKAKKLVHAANLLLKDSKLLEDSSFVNTLLKNLLKKGLYETAADLYERLNKVDLALECYLKGKLWSKALELTRMINPNEVVKLEEMWGDHLVENKHLDAAISHYIEAGKTIKALEAAIAAAQWKKALHILSIVEDNESTAKYYEIIGDHYVAHQEFETAEKIFIKAQMYQKAVAMYNENSMWEKAHTLAVQYLDKSQVYKMYLKEAEKQEQIGKYKEAEKLYLSIDAADMAITMYKRVEQYDNMVRLVEIYHPDLLQTTRLHLGQQLESQGKFTAAEQHYLAAGEWKAAMNMYRTASMWEEAYRVAKQNGGTLAAHQVAFLWAKTLPIDSAIKLLNKYGILETCIDYACESFQFEFAFNLCKNLESKVGDVHYKYAMALEDDGKFQEAEVEFIKAGKPKEAILMYTHGQNWINALRVAEKYEPSAVSEVLQAQALQCFNNKKYSEFESLLLRAQMPEIILEKYKSSDMWVDALRICRDYLPHLLPAIQEEYSASKFSNGESSNVEEILEKANDFIQAGQHKQAIYTLLEINNNITDSSVVRRALLKAADMVNKFLYGQEAVEAVTVLCPRLIEIEEHGIAAHLYISIEKIKEAINCFIANEDWNRARKLAKEVEPSYLSYIEAKYKERLMKEGNLEQLADVDAVGALDLLAEQGQWIKCIDKAKALNAPTLHKYIALYATQLLKENLAHQALDLYNKHGTPALTQNFNIYGRIALDLFKSTEDLSYQQWSNLRQMLFNLNLGISATSSIDIKVKNHFETLLLITHYYAIRSECRKIQQLKLIGVKISVALLRYSDIIPADKAFYEAGVDLRNEGRTSEAFVFLNHYLDICEAIEENESQLIDHSDLNNTDFPVDYALPEQMYLADKLEEHDSIREWVLAISMDSKIDQSLQLDGRNLYESSLKPGELPCVISGYPVLKTGVHFSKSSYTANKDMWAKLNMAAKISPESNVHDILFFIQNWCGTVVE